MNKKMKNKDVRKSIHIFLRSVRLVGNVSKLYFLVQFLSTFIQSICPIISLLLMQNILNSIQLNVINISITMVFIILYISLDIFQTLIRSITGLYLKKVELRFNLWIKDAVLNKSASLSLHEFEDSETYDIIRRAEYAENGSILSYSNAYTQLIGILISSLSYLLILLTLDIRLIPIILIVPLLKYYVTVAINKERFSMIYNRTGKERQKWYFSFLLTNGSSAKELILNNLPPYFISLYNEYAKWFYAQDYTLEKKSTIKNTALSFFEQLIDGGIFTYIVLQGVRGTILIGNVVTYTRSIIQAKSSVHSILLKYAEAQQLELSITQIFKLLDLPCEKDSYPGCIKIETIMSIEAKNLSYRYKTSTEYILKNVAFKIKMGDIMAIVGRNGSGKTTLGKILLGFYLDYEGELLINGIELRQLDLQYYRILCSGLFQDFSKYEATVTENILYGNLNLLDNEALLSTLSRRQIF